jgi:hypothetical protein
MVALQQQLVAQQQQMLVQQQQLLQQHLAHPLALKMQQQAMDMVTNLMSTIAQQISLQDHVLGQPMTMSSMSAAPPDQPMGDQAVKSDEAMVEAAEVIAAKEEAAAASTDSSKRRCRGLRPQANRASRYDSRVLDLIEKYEALLEGETRPPVARIDAYEEELDGRYLNDMRAGRIADGQNLVALPIHLELYILSRHEEVLRTYIETESLFGELLPQLYLIQEWNRQDQAIAFFWTGLTPPGGDTAELFIQAFHGCPLTSVGDAADCFGSARSRGGRPKKGDHLKPEECYVGDWKVSLTYTLLQNLAGSDAKPFTVVTVLGVEADKLRKSEASNKGPAESNRIALASRAMTRILLLRFDDEHQTLRSEDKCMIDWTSIQQEDAPLTRQQLAFDPDKKAAYKNLRPMRPASCSRR